jgi:moderate conductance mechanosensitive channel
MASIDFSTSFGDRILDGLSDLLPRLPEAVFNLLVGILIIRLTTRIARRLMKWFGVPSGLRGVVSSILESFLWIFLVIHLLTVLGFQGVIFFFSGSIAAIGLAMAAGGSTLVSDIIAGVFLAQDSDFNVGDEVIVGETPTQGVIERMDARRIRIRDKKGVLHVIPNSVVERKEWVVVKRRSEISTLARATKAAQQLAAKTPRKISVKPGSRKKDQKP